LTHEGIGKPMSKRRQDLDQRLNAIEAKVPGLLQDPETFARAFEDEVEILLGQIVVQDHAYALERLEAIVDRSGFNG
jgi:hypothetical protein